LCGKILIGGGGPFRGGVDDILWTSGAAVLRHHYRTSLARLEVFWDEEHTIREHVWIERQDDFVACPFRTVVGWTRLRLHGLGRRCEPAQNLVPEVSLVCGFGRIPAVDAGSVCPGPKLLAGRFGTRNERLGECDQLVELRSLPFSRREGLPMINGRSARGF